MRAAFRSTQHRRNRSNSSVINTVPPPRSSSEYSPEHASIAASILYRSPLPSQTGLPVYILNAAAFPDAFEVDYDTLIAYVLARLPDEEELLAGEDYEIIFFAGGQPDSATSEKKTGPGVGWYLQTYHVLSRAIRKRLKKLYVVHERAWVRILIEVFGTIVSPKFKKKIVHVNTLSGLALHLPIEQLLIPPSVYLYDRRITPDIYAPYVSGRRAFAADEPLPVNLRGERRLPRLLRETTTFIFKGDNIQTEGLFRIPAHSQLSGILREAYDRGQQFIIWKEAGVAWTQPGTDVSIVREVHQADCYGVHLAAGLIKLWYRELKRPIFEESCYEDARQRFGDADKDIIGKDLEDVLSPASTVSFLTPAARQILTLHLLPLLASVANYHSENKMTAENLAICFAPALVCGADQLADAKMTSIIRRILEAAVDAWFQGLQERCHTTDEAFAIAIAPPSDPRDYEDPLQETYIPQWRDSEEEEEPHRIILRDGDSDSGRPPLPPRPRAPPPPPKSNLPSRQDSLSSHLKRKPAPPSSKPSLAASPQESRNQTPIDSLSPIKTVVPNFPVAEKEAATADHEPEPHTPLNTSSTPGVFGFAGDEKWQSTGTFESGPQAPLNVIPPTPPHAQNNFIKELQTSLAAETVKRKPVSSPVSPPSPVPESPEKLKSATATTATTATTKTTTQQRSVSGQTQSSTNKDPVFARPTWAASSRQMSMPSVPQSQSSSAPPTRPTIPGNAASSVFAAPAPSLAPAFKARAPSPGLLKRISTIDANKTPEEKRLENERLAPQRLGLKKASVDDLRRMFENRAGATAQANPDGLSRRLSNASAVSRRTSNASLI